MTASYKICGVYLLQKKIAFTLQQGGRRVSDGLCKLRGVGVAQTFKPVASELPRYWGCIFLHDFICLDGQCQEEPLERVLPSVVGSIGPLWCVRQPSAIC
eukprot:3050412-Amphidinium_carterae.1